MARSPEADIELGRSGDASSPSRSDNGGTCANRPCVGHLLRTEGRSSDTRTGDDRERQPTQIEDYPPGYPRYSALIASHDSFHLCRRFSNLRTRLLLLKQDRLSLLEKRLETMDREEASPLSLGSSRRDINKERRSVLSEIDAALVDYDAFLERHQRILGFEAAPRRTVSNLQNWVDGNGCIAREETAYLERGGDLLSVTAPDDNAVTWLEELVGDGRACLRERFGKRLRHPRLDISRDPNVHIFRPPAMALAARVLMTPLITVLLLAPVVICNFVGSLTARLVVVVAATTGFVAVLSGFTRARTVDLVVAGATYTTVLVVFISNTNGSTN